MGSKKSAHLLMVLLVIIWGFDFVPVKWGLEVLTPMSCLFIKYAIGFIILLAIKISTKNKTLVRPKDLPIFLLNALFGEVVYFGCEYTAMDFMPVSLITIMLAFVPVFSVLIERVIFKRKITKTMLASLLVCVFGVAIVIGADFSILMEGRIIGYVLCLVMIICWNFYNYITVYLKEYDSITLSCTQMLCTLFLCGPFAIHSMPPLSAFTPMVTAGMIWIGVIDAAVGFIIIVYGLKIIGATASAVYSNFMPITATFFGALILNESVSVLQILGGIIVIVSGVFVIVEKGRLEDRLKNQ